MQRRGRYFVSLQILKTDSNKSSSHLSLSLTSNREHNHVNRIEFDRAVALDIKELVKAVQSSTTLKKLKLHGLCLCENDAQLLSQALAQNKSIVSLTLYGNALGSQGACILAKGLAKRPGLPILA